MKLLKIEHICGPHASGPPAFCKEIVALGRDGFLVKRDMKPNRDYTNANGVGSRGVYDYYILKPSHMYEVNSPQSWKRNEHYFVLLTEEQQLVRMTYEEVIECLSGGSVSMC